MTATKACPWCGEKFKATTYNRRYCSDNCRKRACDDSHRALCVDCGKPLGERSGWAHNGQGRRNEFCVGCYHERLRVRYPEIRRRWLAGESLIEIAEALGTTVNAIGTTMNGMRKQGWDLPYRYAMQDGKRVAA